LGPVGFEGAGGGGFLYEGGGGWMNVGCPMRISVFVMRFDRGARQRFLFAVRHLENVRQRHLFVMHFIESAWQTFFVVRRRTTNFFSTTILNS
jgi:hypothetical protein